MPSGRLAAVRVRGHAVRCRHDQQPDTAAAESAEMLEALAGYRQRLRYTVRDLADEQAAQRTTVSELCLGARVFWVP